jgi:suppressor for copper-sensitivity B
MKRLFHNRHFGVGRDLWVAVCLSVQIVLVSQMAGGVSAQTIGKAGGDQKVEIRTVWLEDQARPGGQDVLAVVFDVIDDWHIASDKAQAVAGKFKPYFTEVRVSTDDPRLSFGPAQFPTPHKLGVGGLPEPIAVFDGVVVVYVPVLVAGDAEPGNVSVEVAVTYQACDDMTCDFPVNLRLSTELDVVAVDAVVESGAGSAGLFEAFDPAVFQSLEGAPDDAANAQDESSGKVNFLIVEIDPSGPAGFAALLVLAAAGGLLLNFTPCVLPVIPIKILGLAQTAGNRRKTLALGAVMAGGVVSFWLGLGVAIAGVSGFTASNQLFQYPAFSITVGIIIAVMAVGMCGLFAIRLPNFVYSISPKHDSYPGSFGFGVMTAVLSTPCTAPLMGAAAAWAATQDPGSTLATFTAIGVGMALPYLILSANPKLVDRLPRTGPGSELLKQIMGLLMLAAAVFFVGAGISGLMSDGTAAAPKGHWWAVGVMVAVAGGWLIIRVFPATKSPLKRGIFTVFGLVLIAGGGIGATAMTQRDTWVYYTPQRFEKALADGNVVLLDFTADWCANCHLLELTALDTDEVAGMLRSPGVVAMKVDLTGGYPDGKLKLKQTGSVTIPWLVIYDPAGSEVFKANWYTAAQITDALTQAKQSATVMASDQPHVLSP